MDVGTGYFLIEPTTKDLGHYKKMSGIVPRQGIQFMVNPLHKQFAIVFANFDFMLLYGFNALVNLDL